MEALGAEWWRRFERQVLTMLAEGQPERALSIIGERLEWDLAVLWRVETASDRLVAQTIWSAPQIPSELAAEISAARVARGEGQVGAAWAQGRPCVQTPLGAGALCAELAVHARMRAGIWIPLQAADGVTGVLELLRGKEGDLPAATVDALQSIGELVAIYLRAIQTAVVERDQRSRRDLERQVAERNAELAVSRAYLERFYSSDIMGMVVARMDGVVVDANREFLRIAGYTAQDLAAGAVGNVALDTQESRERDEVARRQLLDTGIASAYEREILRKDGSTVPVVLGAATLDGTELVICFVLDNTRRKTVERDLANLNEKLEGFFLERTAELRASEARTAESERRLRALARRLMKHREDSGTAIAREIHDVLGSELTGLKMDINWVLRRLAGPTSSESPVAHRLQEMTGAVDRLVSAVRRIAADLRPPALDDLGLVAALRWWVHEVSKRSDLDIVLEATGDVAVSPALSTALFRITQELLTNVLRHARARRVEVSVTTDDTLVELRVRDDGIGIDNAALGTSLGLTGIRERVLAFGGTFEIGRASAEGGTIATVRMRDDQVDAPP